MSLEKRTFNEILPLDNVVYVIGRINLRDIFINNYYRLYCDISRSMILFSAESGSGKTHFINKIIKNVKPSKNLT